MSTPRLRAIGDAGVAVLAAGGSRALTHRAVDERAGLGPGSTSNLARTRAALLDLTLARITELDLEALAEVADRRITDVTELADLLAGVTHRVLTADRDRTIARYELALESTRHAALRTRFQAEGGLLRERTCEVLRTVGSRDPVAHAARLRALLEGLLFTTAIDGQPVLPRDELVDTFEALLHGLLAPRG